MNFKIFDPFNIFNNNLNNEITPKKNIKNNETDDLLDLFSSTNHKYSSPQPLNKKIISDNIKMIPPNNNNNNSKKQINDLLDFF